jgi:CHASE2 domain-containing sensor protein/serine phosphatase RsbU (regulator of sigma subunit)
LNKYFAYAANRWRTETSRTVGFLMLIAFALLSVFSPLSFNSVRLALFDQYQNLSPRTLQSDPVVVVTIDEETLAALGQWPWPRNYLALLIDSIAKAHPAAIGLDLILPEADRTSPQSVAESRPDLPVEIRQILNAARSNDAQLADSLAATPSVLGAAGFKFKTSATHEGLRSTPVELQGADPIWQLNSYPNVLSSLPEFQAAAKGQGLLSGEPEKGIVRRATLLANLNNSITPGLALEMLRVADGTPHIQVHAGEHGVESVQIGTQAIPLQNNGEAWIHFSRLSERRFISALSLLKGEVAPERIKGKMVLIGLTGLGLQDFISTPLGDIRHGVEIHAQLLESIEDRHFLTRPWWMQWLELCVLGGAGLLLITLISNRRWQNINALLTNDRRRQERTHGIAPKYAVLTIILLFTALFGSGIILFIKFGLLFDAASLFIALFCIFTALLISVFIETARQRNNAEIELQNQRIQAAQLAGELDAARRIQLSTLPEASTAFPGEERFQIAALLESARQVGGDLYDFFMIDKQHLFFIIGDVSGKGLAASLFMLVTKALAKNIALRDARNISEIITQANLEMARENPQMLFVTVVAGILNLENGALELVNAGHDAPLRIDLNHSIDKINGDGGPPLCMLEDFHYPSQHLQLNDGDCLLLLTDGIAEAMNTSKEQYGIKRAAEVLTRTALHPEALINALRDDVRRFVGDTEASDDLTLLAIKWNKYN